jgi:hypothetical protein
MSTPTRGKVTKADIEQKLRNLQGDVEDKIASQRQKIIGAVVAVGVLTMIIAFLLGRRSGKKKNTVVEIRRF